MKDVQRFQQIYYYKLVIKIHSVNLCFSINTNSTTSTQNNKDDKLDFLFLSYSASKKQIDSEM